MIAVEAGTDAELDDLMEPNEPSDQSGPARSTVEG